MRSEKFIKIFFAIAVSSLQLIYMYNLLQKNYYPLFIVLSTIMFLLNIFLAYFIFDSPPDYSLSLSYLINILKFIAKESLKFGVIFIFWVFLLGIIKTGEVTFDGDSFEVAFVAGLYGLILGMLIKDLKKEKK